MADSCDYRGVVDFGDGPVTVRCTEIGPHENHKVEINLGAGPREIIRHNVFEESPDGD